MYCQLCSHEITPWPQASKLGGADSELRIILTHQVMSYDLKWGPPQFLSFAYVALLLSLFLFLFCVYTLFMIITVLYCSVPSSSSSF